MLSEEMESVERLPETVNPNRLLTGTIREKSTPGSTFLVMSRPGPGVLWKSRVLSRIERNAFQLNPGFVRSKALLVTILIDPAKAIPGDSGVGECRTSTRERLFVERVMNSVLRCVVPCDLARPNPLPVIGLYSDPTPLSDPPTPHPPEYIIPPPGTNLRTSPRLPSTTGPNSLAAITFLIFGENRFSLIAMAVGSISGVSDTTNLESVTVLRSPVAGAPNCFRSKSTCTVSLSRTTTRRVST